MAMRWRCINLGVVIAGALAVSRAIATPTNSDKVKTHFEELTKRYVEALLVSSPVTATSLGDHRFDHLLDEVDVAARDRQMQSARAFLKDLQAVDLQALTKPHQVDYALLQQRIRRDIWEIDVLREWEWNPLSYADLPGNSLYELMARDAVPLVKRLHDAGARCRAFPRFFEQARASFAPTKVPRIHAETALDQNRGILKLISALPEPHEELLQEREYARLHEAIGIARAAVNEHQQWLENELLPKAKGNPRLGAERFSRKFALELFTDLSPEDLKARANRQLSDLHNRMYALSKTILSAREPGITFPDDPSPKDKLTLIRKCLEIAYQDAPTRDGVVAAARESLRLTTEFVRAKDLITLPEDSLEIIVMPEFQRGVSLAYCDAPGPLDVGQKTFYAVSPPPKDWTDAQVTSHLREYNLRSLHTLTIHEAMPGHFVQLAHANRNHSQLRAILASGTFIEGWAVYAEWMLCEEGFLSDDPLMKLIVLKWYLRDVANALIDQMIHVDGTDEKAAKAFLMELAFQEEREAAGKVKRALLTSAQLSTYFAGYAEHIELRAAVEKAWGDKFDLKTYHDKLLSFGSPPTNFVRALILDQPIPRPNK